MSASEDLFQFLSQKDRFIPQLSIDSVIFGFHDNQLKILLLKMKGMKLWALPGGYVEQHEDIDGAALHILENRTGLSDIYLEQFRVFGKADRTTKESMQLFLEANKVEMGEFQWMMKRFVSIGYYALVDFSKVTPTPDHFTESCEWFEVKNLPKLAFDHYEIIQKALESLRLNLDSKLIGSNLLPETFTMNDLQSLYETILGTPLRRNNFQRKVLSLNILERIEKLYTGAANKAPYLYKFKKA
ncbi:NUDIX hydrolase [Runella sp.]|uniref:NUDIX hydrolase n=1 Tax=Runella sp. TaxID=1960881 RepID=UPI003D13EA3D